jgi:hypothetical protein
VSLFVRASSNGFFDGSFNTLSSTKYGLWILSDFTSKMSGGCSSTINPKATPERIERLLLRLKPNGFTENIGFEHNRLKADVQAWLAAAHRVTPVRGDSPALLAVLSHGDATLEASPALFRRSCILLR